MTPAERKGLEELLAGGYTGNAEAISWLTRQLAHNDRDNAIERMCDGNKRTTMNTIFDAVCSVTAFDMHAQLTEDGRKRGLWIWLRDESQARAETYNEWATDALGLFCKLAGINAETSEKFRLSMAMDEFKRVASTKVHEAALLEWPAVKKMYAVIGKALADHAPLPRKR